MLDSQTAKRIRTSTITLVACSTLASTIIKRVLGNGIANTINGVDVVPQTIHALVYQRLLNNLS
jgi:ABC-type proline/glycine betaine transport system permease subunit